MPLPVSRRTPLWAWLVLLLMSLRPVSAATDAPPATRSPVAGLWETIDDHTHQPKSWVELYESGDSLAGRVVRLLDLKTDPHAVCRACTGERQGKPILGMTILWGLSASDSARRVYEHGTVLDPSNGKEYRCRVRLLDDGQLEIRGFIGLPLLGRSQVWRRVKDAATQSPEQ